MFSAHSSRQSADRLDQMAFLTLSGVSYAYTTNGQARVGSDLPNLAFAADVSAPTSNRHFRWDAVDGLTTADTSSIAAADTPSWKMLVELKALAEESFVKPIRMDGGVSVYNVFMTPTALSVLKQDTDFLANIRNSAPRSNDNVLFKGSDSYYVDGLAIHSYRHVYNTRRATTKWGSGHNVDGCRILLCGAQALGFADIGMPEWTEKGFDYDNRQGIAYGKILGFKKPKFASLESGTTEDFGVICVDVAQ